MTKHKKIAATLMAPALALFAAQSAHAGASPPPVDLTLQSITDTYSNISGNNPTVDTTGGSQPGTSNAGNVTVLTLPYMFDLPSNGNSVAPTDPLFVVEPNSSGSGTIHVTFNFTYSSVNYPLVENVAYTAIAGSDYDSLIWQAGTNGTCNGNSVTDECTYSFAIDGQKFGLQMDNETDWNMAEFDGATTYNGSTVPEPASLAIFGAALVGFGATRRRRKSV